MTALLQLGRRLVIAHRGASLQHPENTLPAFERALALGADALELDIRLARDGTAVVIHDATVDRTTSLTGAVVGFDASELARLGIPTLAEVLAAFPSAELLIEIKEAAAQPAVRRAIEATHAEERCVVAAASSAALLEFRGGRVALCGARADVASLRWRSLVGLSAGRCAYRTLSVPRSYRGIPVATRTLFQTAAAVGVPVHVWTVDDPTVARSLWAAGATGIVTNDPEAILRARAALVS